jgi:hypothetical protein
MWVYIESESYLDESERRCRDYTVGFYRPTEACGLDEKCWVPESDWSNAEAARRRVNYLNGGTSGRQIEPVDDDE